MPNRKHQRGVTLIEMMIAMVVSLVLVAGVGTVYFSSKRSYQVRDELSQMNEAGRAALETLRKHLEHAGYATPSKLPLGAYFFVNGDPNLAVQSCGGGKQNIKDPNDFNARSTRDAFNANGDAISVRFLGDNNLFLDAAGGALPDECRVGNAAGMDASLIYNAFHVDNDGSTRDANNRLVPILYALGSNVNNRQPVVNGIENIQFQYGIDTDGNGTADRFVNATNVGAANWESVVSIKVAILVRSLGDVLEANSVRTYNLLDATVTTPSDRYQRAVYTTTIQLRNVVDN
ncbi:PilW family protein [Candidatus Thiothrix anitrata]|uniref:PilW family protein n=1 Tax=Candidatus Thiothrix anitrata TaxID=2823902 RepID=A0ABX7X9D6_9GAMM|nr:PilW family protein [Candidatus Thiothrix anitrata]QTR51844.1 PilW family protein [Candidatus Thiothrix anitrata]